MTMIHAENTDCIAWLTEQLVAAGQTAPRFHATSRPDARRARGHASRHRVGRARGPAGAHRARVGQRGRGADSLGAGPRPQGLRRDLPAVPLPHRRRSRRRRASKVPSASAARRRATRPTRRSSGMALENGVFQVFSSDHAPFRYDGPARQGGGRARTPAFNQVPNGIPGLETRLPLLFSEGVLEDRIDINTFVALTATNAAKLYGLYPAQGHDRHRQRRRPRDLGHGHRRHDRQCAPAPRRGLHALRRARASMRGRR